MKLYTIAEVAQILRLSKRTVYSYIEYGYLRAIQVGEKKALRIPEDALQEFLKLNQTTLEIVPLSRRTKKKSS
ncbi:MAG: helix-turn-helix domain-containing protein [Thermocrinis sp.]|jgi:excisionase family DNA binding protein|uniref:helix-turn-helix domain-containing protein n=1 Tax=Thermocrinis sp. TaxID=2024383 RepID=UPI003C02B801